MANNPAIPRRRSQRVAAGAPPPAAPAFTCSNWPCFVFQGHGNRTVNLQAWINKIDQEWPTLNAADRVRVRAHADRWGPNQDPRVFAPNVLALTDEDFARTRCFRSVDGPPKCHSCRQGGTRLRMAYRDIPIGLDGFDRVPCGCSWLVAMVEYWTILIGAHTQRTEGATPHIIVVGLPARIWMVSVLGMLLGGQQNITWARLVSRRAIADAINPPQPGIVRRQLRAPLITQNTQWPQGS